MSLQLILLLVPLLYCLCLSPHIMSNAVVIPVYIQLLWYKVTRPAAERVSPPLHISELFPYLESATHRNVHYT